MAENHSTLFYFNDFLSGLLKIPYEAKCVCACLRVFMVQLFFTMCRIYTFSFVKSLSPFLAYNCLVLEKPNNSKQTIYWLALLALYIKMYCIVYNYSVKNSV